MRAENKPIFKFAVQRPSNRSATLFTSISFAFTASLKMHMISATGLGERRKSLDDR